MLIRTTGAAILLLLLPLALAAQEAKTTDQLDKEVQDLKTQLDKVTADLAKLNQKLSSSSQTAEENKQNIQSVLDQLSELNNALREQIIKQQESLGSTALRLNANMQDEDFRQQMQKVVNDSLQQEGDVLIRNKMAAQQRVTVNQKDYDIKAGETLTLKVPVGTVTVQLPDQALTNWALTAPKYEQIIDIVPQPQKVTTYRPVDATTVTTSAPVIMDTPIYVSPPVTTYYVDPFTGTWYWSSF